MSNSDKNYCTFYLVRHGETEWNVQHITQGQSDSPLTAEGLPGIEATAQELKDIKFDAIFSSDLGRAKTTAEIIKLDRDLAIQTSELLRERSFGKFEGMAVDDYRNITKDIRDTFKQLPAEEKWNYRLGEGVESDQELVDRFLVKIREIAVAMPGQNVLVVTHGGCLRLFLVRIGYATREELYPGAFKNAGYIKILSDGIDFFIEEVKGFEKKHK